MSTKLAFAICLLLLVLLLSGCAPLPPATPPASVPGESTYTDPFAYCAAVGTIDSPDARYTGPELPEAVVNGLNEALELPGTPAPPVAQGTVWRCMDGQVYACTVGANLPCLEKADTGREPNEGMTAFCQEQPDAEVIPAAAAGRSTVYEWRCKEGKPEIVKQVFDVDPQGFLSGIWYPLTPSGQ